MATLERVLPALRAGATIGLESRMERAYHLKDGQLYCIEFNYNSDYPRYQMDVREMLASDWVVRVMAHPRGLRGNEDGT